MEVLQVQEYNQLNMAKWHKRVELWKKENLNNIIPQIAFVGFRTRTGEMRKTGYVAFEENKAYYGLTKTEAIGKFLKDNCDLCYKGNCNHKCHSKNRTT